MPQLLTAPPPADAPAAAGGFTGARDLAAVTRRLTTAAAIRAFLLRSLPLPPGMAPRRPLP